MTYMVKPALTIESIHETVISLLGPVSELRRLAQGEESQVFGFRHGGDDLVLRVNPEGEGFHKDRFAHQKFATASLPTPEVLDIGTLDDGHAWCLSRLVPGITLQEMTPDALASVLAPTTQVLNAIAASDLEGTAGYGPFDANGRGRYDTWRAFVLDAPDPAGSAWRAAADVVDLERIHGYIDEIRRLAAFCPEDRHLVHGDFGSNNVLSDGTVITGVIDWSEAMFGDSLYDIANFFFWRSWLTCMELQARHFEQTLAMSADVWQRLRCYALPIGVVEFQQAAPVSLATWTMRRCDEVLTGGLRGPG